MTRGTYSLLIHISNRVEIKVGALGTLPLPEGYYVYTGSAFGPGGFSRIERHRDNFQHGVDSPHWHIDYLAQAPETQLTAVYVSPGRDIECAVNRDLGGDPVDGFGSSDCQCTAHLQYIDAIKATNRLEALHEQRLPAEG